MICAILTAWDYDTWDYDTRDYDATDFDPQYSDITPIYKQSRGFMCSALVNFWHVHSAKIGSECFNLCSLTNYYAEIFFLSCNLAGNHSVFKLHLVIFRFATWNVSSLVLIRKVPIHC